VWVIGTYTEGHEDRRVRKAKIGCGGVRRSR
jgi:hypothetical protein